MEFRVKTVQGMQDEVEEKEYERFNKMEEQEKKLQQEMSRGGL